MVNPFVIYDSYISFKLIVINLSIYPFTQFLFVILTFFIYENYYLHFPINLLKFSHRVEGMSKQLNSNGEMQNQSDQGPGRHSNDQLECLSALIKCVKDREDLYFELLGFISKNIESTSSMIDQLSLFDRFVGTMHKKDKQLRYNQDAILFNQNNNPNEQMEKKTFRRLSVKAKKLNPPRQNPQQQQVKEQEALRLFSRVMQILQGSISKARKSIVNDNNRMVRQFNKFKNQINTNFSIMANPTRLNPMNPSYKMVKQQEGQSAKKFHVPGFVRIVSGYISAKFKREIDKIEKYLQKLENGEDISFKDLIIKKRGEGSDMSQESANQKKISPKKKRLQSNSESPVKKSSAGNRGSKQKHRVLSKKEKDEDKNSECAQTSSPKKNKALAANKMIKMYALMQLNKKQFLQDYIYEKNKEEEQKTRLMNSLLQKNKAIRQQIKQYKHKTINYEQKIRQNHKNLLQVSSDENHFSRNQSSAASKISLRTSFVISKRRSSFQLQKQSSDNKQVGSDEERKPKIRTKNQSQNPLSKTMKSVLTPRRKASSSTNKKSKRIFVVKPPMLFQDEIPKAPVTQTAWMQNPITFREKQMIQCRDKQKQRKRNEPIRLKKRNNPFPLQNTFLPQSFQYNSSRYS